MNGDADGLVAIDERAPDTTKTVEDVGSPKERKPAATNRLAYAVGLVIIVALAALTGWLGLRAYESQRSAEQRQTFL